MAPSTIWRKTLIFSWIRLGIGLLTFMACLLIGGAAWIIISNTEFAVTTKIAIGCSAFLIAVIFYYVVMSRFGYGIQMGQLAIVERADRGEAIPANPVQFSKDVVKERFGSSRQFYTIQRNIHTARNQLLRVISRGFSLEQDTPDFQGGGWMRVLFCLPAIQCIDECCLSYALRRNDYEVNAAAVDALTILMQDWKRFIRRATLLSAMIYGICLVLLAIFFLPGFYLLKSMAINPLLWLGVSFFLVMTVKVAFIDSYTITKIVCGFLELTQNTKISSVNYTKLDSWSKMYEKLRKSAENAAIKASKKDSKEEPKALTAEQETADIPEKSEESAKSEEKEASEEEAKPEEEADKSDQTEQPENAETSGDAEKA